MAATWDAAGTGFAPSAALQHADGDHVLARRLLDEALQEAHQTAYLRIGEGGLAATLLSLGLQPQGALHGFPGPRQPLRDVANWNIVVGVPSPGQTHLIRVHRGARHAFRRP